MTNMSNKSSLYIVRLYDYFDNMWIDVSSPLSQKDAQDLWNQKTDNGTKKCKIEHCDYYAIFPADTVMLFSSKAIANEQKEFDNQPRTDLM
jgi:hypothetical protein